MITPASQPLTHVYFDFFGTLVDYDPSVLPTERNAPHEYAVRAGFRVEMAEANALWQSAWAELDDEAHRVGRECTMLQIAGRYAELLAEAEADEGAGAVRASEPGPGELERLVAEYLDAWTSGIRIADSAIECLADLARDHTLAVVSNTHDSALVPRMLRRFGLDGFFTDVFTSVDLGWRKPHPEIFRSVLDSHGVAADRAAFVGDNWVADVEGPRAFGMRTYYVGAPEPGRDPVTLAELPALVRR